MTDIRISPFAAAHFSEIAALATGKHREAMAAAQAGDLALAVAAMDDVVLLTDDMAGLVGDAASAAAVRALVSQIEDQRQMLVDAVARGDAGVVQRTAGGGDTWVNFRAGLVVAGIIGMLVWAVFGA